MHAKGPAVRGKGVRGTPAVSASIGRPGAGRLRLAGRPQAPARPEGPPGPSKDHFTARDGREFAGAHLIVDLWVARAQASRLCDLQGIEVVLRRCVEAAGATLLHIHLHHFGPGSGVSGVAVLAESHISVHTWPERGFAAFDVFMCGQAQPERAVAVLLDAFEPESSRISETLRGESR